VCHATAAGVPRCLSLWRSVSRHTPRALFAAHVVGQPMQLVGQIGVDDLGGDVRQAAFARQTRARRQEEKEERGERTEWKWREGMV
jgi:hypothetical protein